MPVQCVHQPMKQGRVLARDAYFLVPLYGRVVNTMLIVEADILVGKEAIHPVAKDEVFRHAALQAFTLGQEPKLVGQYQGLLDVVGG